MNETARPWERFYPEGVRWAFTPQITTLPALFMASVDEFAAENALEYQGRFFTYAELGEWTGQVANALRGAGIGKGSTVALYLPNGPFHPFYFFGTHLTGGRIAHLSPLDALRELEHKCRDSGADILVTLAVPQMMDAAAKLLEIGAIKRVILCDEAIFSGADSTITAPDGMEMHHDFVAGAAKDLRSDDVTPDDIALLQYTGGTTGLPKGAMLTHRNLTAAIESYQQWFSYMEDNEAGIMLCVLPLFHIYALTVLLLRQIKMGGTLVLHQRFDPDRVLDDIERLKITNFPGVPTMWIALCAREDISKRDLSSLAHVSSGGAPLPVETATQFRDLTGLQLLGGWGMTETSPAGTNLPKDYPPEKKGSIGIPLPGVDLQIVSVDDPTKVLPPGEPGEMRVKGENVTKGYWNKPEENKTAFVDGYFLTGDICVVDEDGFFYLVDRKKDMILSGGFNVYPQVVEQAVYEHPSVFEAIAVGIPDEYRGEAIKVFISLKPDQAAPTLDELRDFLRDKLGKHELPQHLEIRDALPRTSVGKLSRKELRAEEQQKAKA